MTIAGMIAARVTLAIASGISDNPSFSVNGNLASSSDGILKPGTAEHERARGTRCELTRSYGEIVAADLPAVGVVLPNAAYCSAAGLFEPAAPLPFTPRSSSSRHN